MRSSLQFLVQLHYRRIIVFVFVLIFNGMEGDGRQCSPSFKGLGWTEPAGDIVLKENPTSAITNSVSDPKSSLEVTTNTTSDGEIVCLNIVSVGTLPKPVENFTCISYDWSVLNCSWISPNNSVKTKYTVEYTIPHRPGRNHRYSCPSESKAEINNWCAWSQSNYRRNFEFLNMHVIGENLFGVNHQPVIRFHNYAHILPSAPKHLKAVETTYCSFLLEWHIDDLVAFEKGWEYSISYMSNGEKNNWTTMLYDGKRLDKLVKKSHSLDDKDAVYVNVTDLKYPNTLYDFRVMMRSAIAPPNEGWSQPASLVVRTKACIPYRSPRTGLGSFELVPPTHPAARTRDVYIYWQPLSPKEYNGEDFKYDVQVFEEEQTQNGDTSQNDKGNVSALARIQLKPITIRNSYAKFEIGLKSYTFQIYSANAEGRAETCSIVRVPSHNDVMPTPSTVSKTDYNNGVYEISWKMASVDSQKVSSQAVDNYTLFWCESVREYPSGCDGYIDWVTVPSNISKYNLTVSSSKAYQFAMSINSPTGVSSGMEWARCTVLHDGRVPKIKKLSAGEVGSYWILAQWNLECSERIDTLKGYYIQYCSVLAHNATACNGPIKNLTIDGDLSTDRANITELDPFSYYMISVAMISSRSRNLGPPSDPIINKTRDGKPDISNVMVKTIDKTNTSVSLTWTEPNVTNGVIQHYLVSYSSSSSNHGRWVQGDHNVPHQPLQVNITNVTLTNLMSFEEYTIKVQACTLIYCSDPSTPLRITTKVGKPGEIVNVSPHQLNTTHELITWARPVHPGGPTPYYRIRIEYTSATSSKNTVSSPPHTVTTTTSTNSTIVDLTSCNSGSFAVQIRAENVDPANNTIVYAGEWSMSPLWHTCPDGTPFPTSLRWAIILAVFLIIAAVSATSVKKVMHKCQQMQNVDITLPAKFTVPPTAAPLFQMESKNADFYDAFLPLPSKSVEEFCTLMEKPTELDILPNQHR